MRDKDHLSNAESLYRFVSDFTGMEIEEFQFDAYSVFGQRIPILDQNGMWKEHLFIEHVGYSHYKILWSKKFHDNMYIEWIVRSWLIDRISSNIDLHPNIKILSLLGDLVVCSGDAESIERDIYNWIDAVIGSCRREEREVVVVGAKLLYGWALENELPGFSEESFDEISWGHEIVRRSSNLVRFHDIQSGPYTAEELDILDNRVAWSSNVSTRLRAQFLICRDWGLRPIQIALLRAEDLGRDDLGPYLYVPSVKGARRSRLRRSTSNLVKRYISDDTDIALRCQIESADKQCERSKERLYALMKEFGIEKMPPIGLFPAQDARRDRLLQFCRDVNIFEYVLHTQSNRISREIASLTKILSIPMSRTDLRMDNENYMSVSAYRLRRTKGTSLVLSGHSQYEVAEALDHSSINSVSHYFQYSRDVHDFLNRTASSSPAIMEAINIWDGRLAEDDIAEKGDRPIGSLGRCKLKNVCPDQPAVTCYACNSFRPHLNADHEAALKSIEIFQEQVSFLSTSALKGKLDREINGAKALIKVIILRKIEDEK